MIEEWITKADHTYRCETSIGGDDEGPYDDPESQCNCGLTALRTALYKE